MRWLVVPIWLLVAGTAAADDRASEAARKRWHEGVAAFDRQDYETARVAFEQAYTLKPTLSVLRNLAECELRTGRYLPSARHLARYLQDGADAPMSDRANASASLVEAEKHVGRVEIDADPWAVVSVDGTAVELDRTIYVEPGKHSIRADRGSDVATDALVAKAGETTKATLRFSTKAAALAPAKVPEPAAPAAAASAPKTASPEPDDGTHWRTVAVVTGTGLTAVALSVGIGFAAAASSRASDAQALGARERERGGPSACAVSPSSACVELSYAIDSQRRDRNAAAASFVAASVLGVATVGAFLWWPSGVSVAAGPGTVQIVGRF